MSSLALVVDLVKGRRKGSINQNHTWVARFRTVGSDKWQYIYPDDKELNDKGELKDTRPITVIRRFFGVEKPSEVEQRVARKIKAPVPFAQTQEARLVTTWGEDKKGNKVPTGRKVAGKNITPYGTVAALEMSPKYAEQVREFPDSVKQFLATPEQEAAFKQKLREIPVGEHGGEVPQDPTIVPVGVTPLLHVIRTKPTYDPAQLKDGVADVQQASAVKLARTKTTAKPGMSLVVRVTKHDPRLVAKYGDESVLEEHLRVRPLSTKLTAGELRRTTKVEGELLKEWDRDIYSNARAAVRAGYVHTKAYRKRYERDEIDGRNPHTSNASAQSYLNDRASDVAQELREDFVRTVRQYKPKLDDENDRFDKVAISRMHYGAKKIVERELKGQNVEVPIDAQEAHDVNAKLLSAVDIADYKKYAPVAVHYLDAAMGSLSAPQRKIIEMRLWLDSPSSEKEERKEIANRIGVGDEASWEPPAEGTTRRALKHFERSFSEIAMKQSTWKTPDGNTVTWDVKNADPSIAKREMSRATDTLERWYRDGLEKVLAHFASDKKVRGEDGKDQIHDPKTGLFFNPQGYAVYRWLEVATKLARSVKPRSMPEAPTLEVKHEVLNQYQIKPHSESRPIKYKELDFLEKHPVLRDRLNLAPGARETSKLGENVLVPPVPAPLPRKYGLPEMHTKNRPLKMTPEQERRFKVIQGVHTFMQHIGGMKTSKVKDLHQTYSVGLAKVKTHLGGKTPEKFVEHMQFVASKLGSPDSKVRREAKQKVRKMARDFHDAKMRAAVGSISQDVLDVLALPRGERVKHFNALPLDAKARELGTALRRMHGESEMLRYTHESRTGTVKAMPPVATVHTFMLLVEEYEAALDQALARAA